MSKAGSEPKWLTLRMAMAIHDEAIAMFGGTGGIRDAGLLEGAISRAQNRHTYDSAATLFDLAAALCHGICKNNPFLDGNKRTALLSARAFLFLNGQAFEPKETDEVENMVAVASGGLDEAGIAAWFSDFSTPIAPRRK